MWWQRHTRKTVTETSQNLEKSTSETGFAELWQRMSHNQRRFAVAMLDATTKKEAALAIGLEPNTVYGWNGEVDQAVAYMQQQTRDAVLGIIEANAVKAAMVKAAGLDSQDEIRRQDAASELLDRYLGRPFQRTELTGAGGGPVGVTFISNVDDGNL